MLRLSDNPGKRRAVPNKSAADAVMDGGGLSGSHIPMPELEAAALLEQIYGITGTLERLPAEKDDTFKVLVAGKPMCVLKVANPHDPDDELDFQTKLLLHVINNDSSIPVPRILESIAGNELTTIVDNAGQKRKVWAITFLPGAVLDTFDTTASERERIGEVLGKLRNATADFSHPFDSRIIAWDVKHLARLYPLIDFVEDNYHREKIYEGFDRIAQLQPQIDSLRTQVLHNDFSRSNILGDRAKPEFITGIIDFGDASRTAVAVDDELRLIPHLTFARVLARAVITTRRAQMFPHNSTYILRNTQPGWGQLDWFMVRTIDEISQSLKEKV